MSTQIPQRTDEVVLYQDDDRHEIDRLRQAVESSAARSRTPLRLGDDDDVRAAAEAFDSYVIEAAERGTTVVVKNIGGRQWRSVVAEHPPREKNEDDAEWGYNVLTFGDVVVPLCVVSIGGNPVDKAAAEAAVDEMTDGDFSRVYSAVVRVNTGRGPDPKASISEQLRTTSPEISESPARLG